MSVQGFVESSKLPQEELARMEPEDLGMYLLQYLIVLQERGKSQQPGLQLQSVAETHSNGGNPGEQAFKLHMCEAWGWLEREGLLMTVPPAGSAFVTRRGMRLKGELNLGAYGFSSMLPKSQLHPVIATHAWGPFIRGEYETAVFAAFKEVEIAVRAAAKYPEAAYGADMLRKAFASNGGPLADSAREKGEQDALAQLFGGAYGYFRNPGGHRRTGLAEPQSAAEQIFIASHLMRIVDERREAIAAAKAPPAPESK